MRKKIPLILVAFCCVLCATALGQQKKKGGAADAPPPAAEPKKPVYTGKDIPQGPLENLVAKVGPGGVTKGDYDFQLLKLANSKGKKIDALSKEERKTAFDTAIEEELVFQGALADGALKDDYICWMIISQHKSDSTTAKINPEAFTEEELQKFYKANPKKFTTPAEVHAEGMKFPTESDEEIKKVIKQAAEKPDAAKGWVDVGWIKEGNVGGGLTPDVCDQIVKLKKGQVSGIIFDKAMRMKCVFRAVERTEGQLLTYEEAKGKIKFELIGVKQEEMQKKLVAQSGKKGMSEDEILLNAGLQAGTHRFITIRNYIIPAYLAKKKGTREQVLPDLKKRFKVEILAKD